MKLDIKILDKETGKTDNIETDGFLLLYFSDQDKVKSIGKMDLKILTPLLTRIVLERLAH